MTGSISDTTLEKFTTFGDLLRFLRRRAGITQMELAIAVGYSDGQISRLEQSLRMPDIPTVEARFISALYLEDEERAVRRLLELAANVRREDAPALGLCPYKGLNYFDENDAELFVGREALTARLMEGVLGLASRSEPAPSRFLAIVGASGSGKSSLVRAGLIPGLRWDKKTVGWQIHAITPTATPLDSLAETLTQGGSVAATAALGDSLAHEPRSLHLFARQLAKARNSPNLLLVVDQFEELFALCRSEAERRAFIDNLLTAATAPGGPTIVVITLRADFYASCAAYPELREALARHQEYIGAMSGEELRRAIEEPARRGHWNFEPGLVDLLLHEVGQEPGALPLLSHALLETWERRRGDTMTLSGYTSSGGVRGAIAETADAVFADQFTGQQQAIARRIFLRLTELGEESGAGDTRRRAAFSELSSKQEEGTATRAVLKALADARLITLSEDAAEVAHEALIREWPRLRGWLQDNREGLRLHRQFAEAARDWDALQRDPDALYRGLRLTQMRQWAAANPDELNALEGEFLNASIEAAEREATERETRRQAELESAQNLARAEKARAEEQTQSASRLRTRNRIISAVGSVGLILAILAGLFGVQARYNLRAAQANFTHAESLRLADEASVVLAQGGDPQLATLLSIRALESGYSIPADAALSASISSLYNRQILRGHTATIYSVTFSPDGKYALTGSQDGTARLWDVHAGQQLKQFAAPHGGISAVAFSPDGRFILTGGNDGIMRLWNAATGEQLRVFSGHTSGLTAVAFAPDGQSAVSASGDDTARIWDVTTGRQRWTLSGHTDLVSDATYSPDGRLVLTSSFDGTARLWDAASGSLVRTFPPSPGPARLNSAAFSPTGKSVLTGSDDHTAALWDAETGEKICSFTGHTGAVSGVTFSPDGKYALTGGADQTAREWDLQTCKEMRRYMGLDAAIKSVAFSPDGQLVLAGGQDGLGYLWATPAARLLRTFPHQTGGIPQAVYSPSGNYVTTPGGVNGVVISPDGKTLLTGGDDRVARLWDVTTGKELLDFVGHTEPITAVAFSPDGRHVLTGSLDQTARLWDTATGRQVYAASANAGGVYFLAFLQDGKHFLTLGSYNTTNTDQTLVWDVATGRETLTVTAAPGINNGTLSSIFGFSTDGRAALAWGSGDDVTLVDIQTGRELCNLKSAYGPRTNYLLDQFVTLAFSANRNFAVYVNYFGTAELWDVRDCKQLEFFANQGTLITNAAFSPDSKYVLTGHDDNKARLWDVAARKQVREFTGHTSWITSVTFSPDGRYVVTGSEDGTARLWDTDYHDTIRFACSMLWRDLTSGERIQYSISDNGPTCPQP